MTTLVKPGRAEYPRPDRSGRYKAMAWTVVGAAIAGMLITGKAKSDPDVLDCP
ncbi:MAG TPA: hypothetical protein VLF40_00515 [Candidatus Saccharimonadales bacterium]|nr:hypothetical protein [Candidatus Saccharimonadales bacterium]